MKSNIKGFICGVVVTSLIGCTVVCAAEVWEKIDVLRNYMNVIVNGTKVNADNFLFNDTTYVPIRAVSEALGKDVRYDPATNTAEIGDKNSNITSVTPPAATSVPAERVEIFTSEDIPDDVKAKMLNVTISDSSQVTFADLKYLTITYFGYDEADHIGHMVVAADLANDVLEIFKELYNVKFPIEKMSLACEYNGSDELSMEDNNTSIFNDRPIEGTNSISNHALGRAIDINPLINPYIKNGTVLPVTAEKYLDRSLDEKGIITSDGVCVQIFKNHGWTWGGDWHSLKDYQHFEKVE